MSYKIKYIKYKNKYLNLKNNIKGGLSSEAKYTGVWIDGKWNDSHTEYIGKYILNHINSHIFDGIWNGEWNSDQNEYTGEFKGVCTVDNKKYKDCYFRGKWFGDWENKSFTGIYYNNLNLGMEYNIANDKENLYKHNFNWFTLNSYISNFYYNDQFFLNTYFSDSGWYISDGIENGYCAIYAVYISLHANNILTTIIFPKKTNNDSLNKANEKKWYDEYTITLFVNIINKYKELCITNECPSIDTLYYIGETQSPPLNLWSEQDILREKENMYISGIGTIGEEIYYYIAAIYDINIITISSLSVNIYLYDGLVYDQFNNDDKYKKNILNKFNKKTNIFIFVPSPYAHYYTLYNINKQTEINTIIQLIMKI